MSTNSFAESWLPGPQSTQFYTRTYTPSTRPKAVVVFLHGFAEHVGRYTHFHPHFPERGVALFTFDQRGYGKTAQDDEHKSKDSAYGKTCWKAQMEDIDWALGHAKKEFSNVPVFLMGHSMGGGEILGFATQGEKSSCHATISSLAGVIATSPLIEQFKPAPKLLRWVGGKISALAPYKLIPTSLNPEHLSHDHAMNEAYMKDPLIRLEGSLRGVNDMLSQGEALLQTQYKNWPKNLPVLFVHGTGDQITSYTASQAFHDKINAQEKKITLFPGGFHELQNEPDGVKEKLANEVLSFIEAHLSVEAREVEPSQQSGERSRL